MNNKKFMNNNNNKKYRFSFLAFYKDHYGSDITDVVVEAENDELAVEKAAMEWSKLHLHNVGNLRLDSWVTHLIEE